MRSSLPSGFRFAAIVPAAGSGERLGGGPPKALRELGGTPMLVLAVAALLAHSRMTDVVVAAPVAHLDVGRELLARLPTVEGQRVQVVAGGATRQESVRAALDAIAVEVTHILVHDAARPFVPVEVVGAVVDALEAGASAVVPVLPVVDTIKRVAEGRVVETVPRDELGAVQTPQGFRRDVLDFVHSQGNSGASDDSLLAELSGYPVVTVPGSDEAFKITRALDLLLAEAVLAHRSPV